MFRCKFALAALMMGTIFVGWGMTQPGKDLKDPPVKQPAEQDSFKDDLRIVKENGYKGDGPDLVEYFRKKTLKQPEPKEIASLIKELGDDDFATREKAFTQLVGMGETKDVMA